MRGTDIVVEVTLQNGSFITATGTLKVYEARLALQNGTSTTYVSLNTPSNQPFSIGANGGTQTFTWTFSGAPNYVAVGNLEVRAEARGNVGVQLPGELDARSWGSTSWQTWEKVYLTYDTPVGYQTVPWTDLLDYSCSWAFGESTESLVNKKETFGLYWGSIFAYNLGTEQVGSNWIQWDNEEPEFGKFKLAQLLNDLSSSGIQSANCVDVSSFLQLLLASQGEYSQLQRLVHVSGTPPAVFTFVTNTACPIGSDGTLSSLYFNFDFSMHQQTLPSTGVCDAALAYDIDLTGATYMNPAANWQMDDYWQTLLSSSPLEIAGLAYRSLLSTDTHTTLSPPLPPWNTITTDPNFGPSLISFYADFPTLNGVF